MEHAVCIFTLLLAGLSLSFCTNEAALDGATQGNNGGVTVNRYKYMSRLTYRSNIHVCSCSIIHNRYHITAGTCFDTYGQTASEYFVHFGTSLSNQGGGSFRVDFIHFYRNFKRTPTLIYNVAIVETKERITFGSMVNRMPQYLETGYKPVLTDVFHTIGWGTANPQGRSRLRRQLTAGRVFFRDGDVCTRAYGPSLFDPASMLCADPTPFCAIDLGSPVVDISGKTGDTLVGIVSHAPSCTNSMVYTRTSSDSIYDWIIGFVVKRW